MNRLTIKEKIALCSGLNEWDTKEIKRKDGTVIVPSVKVADGPHGLRKTLGKGDNLGLAQSFPATCFPTESIVACSFDVELVKEMGQAIAKEARKEGVSTVLGPGVNIKRNPLCGRNFEYFSEDPYASGMLASAYIDGVQSMNVGTSIKHFACNSQEYYRMTSDSQLKERELREIYLTAFEMAIKQSKPSTIMCAYNKINGINCSDNEFLLNHILRKEWGYKGLVISDWGALHDRIQAFKAGCDLVMPGGSAFEEKEVWEAIQNGSLNESYVDRCASRVAKFAKERKEKMNSIEDDLTLDQIHNQSHVLAQKIAEQSAVLMKNEDSILPIQNWDSVCVIGSMAEDYRIQGAGSSKINPWKQESFLQNESYVKGYEDKENEALIEEAIELAKQKEKVIVFAGLPESYEAEGLDRRTLSLPDQQNTLIEEIVKVNKNVVVVLISGCVVEIPWADRVKGILWMGLSGQAGPLALRRILSGEVNPSGKLSETWPIQYKDCPSSDVYLKNGIDAQYKEGIYVGYRYYDTNNIPVRYPFGHGLSYTTFEYSDCKVEGRNVSITIRNTGITEGKETVLMYIESPQDGIHRPIRELKGFQKVSLQPSESCTISLPLEDRSFAVWNNGWIVYEGDYTICIGSCREKIHVEGASFEGVVQSEAFEKSLSYQPVRKNRYTKNSTIAEVSKDVLLLRAIYNGFEKIQNRTYGKDSVEYLSAMSAANEIPLRAAQNLLGIKNHFAQAIADFGNKEYIKGIKNLLR